MRHSFLDGIVLALLCDSPEPRTRRMPRRARASSGRNAASAIPRNRVAILSVQVCLASSAGIPGQSRIFIIPPPTEPPDWSNPPTLDRYLTAPREVVPGTLMSYPGLKDEHDRSDLIAYLASLR